MSRIQNKALKLHSSSIRPRAVKVQSPPYPITGSEEIIEASWGLPEAILQQLVKRTYNLDTCSFDDSISSISLRSIVLEEEVLDNVNFYDSVSTFELRSVVIEQESTDFASFDDDVSKLSVTQVVVSNTPPSEPTTFDDEISLLRLV